MQKANIYLSKCLFLFISTFMLSCQDAETVKLQVYISEGQRLYEQKCANCHQKDGTGLRKLIPPLANADFLKLKQADLACIVKYGITGKIIVNQQGYDLSMPANEGLSERHIAQILTYVTHKWAQGKERITDEYVKKAIEECKPNQ